MNNKKQIPAKKKAAVAIEAIQGIKTKEELSKQYGISESQIDIWKEYLLSNAIQVFGTEYNIEKNERNERKAKIAIEAIQGIKTKEELSKQYDMSESQIDILKKEFVSKSHVVFEPQKKIIKRIKIYIACSTKSDILKNKKESIVSLCKRLNIEFAQKNDCEVVKIFAVGYDAQENDDVVSKKFIKRNADIVVFLFDKNHDEKEKERLEQKLSITLKNFYKKRRPEILVYLPDDVENSLTDKTREVLKKDSINIKRFGDSNLEEVVEQNIRTFYNSYEMVHNVRKGAVFIKIFITIFIALLFGAIIGVSIWKINNAKNEIEVAREKARIESQKRIFIAGGGSAKNYIEKEIRDSALLADPYWIYAPIASGSAYRLLTEEMAMEQSEKSFYTIILSAGKTGDTSFFRCAPAKKDKKIKEQEIKNFRNFGSIVGIHLGMDSLMVYCTSDLFNTNNEYLSTSDLETIYKKWTDSIYTTNENSGTLKLYNKLINKEIKPVKIFYSSDSIGDESWIIFGSKYYHPKFTHKDSVKMKKYTIKDTLKPIYVYFMKYRDNVSNAYQWPWEVKRFLSKGLYLDTNDLEKHTISVDTATNKFLFDNFCVDPTCKDTTHIKIKKIKHAK